MQKRKIGKAGKRKNCKEVKLQNIETGTNNIKSEKTKKYRIKRNMQKES